MSRNSFHALVLCAALSCAVCAQTLTTVTGPVTDGAGQPVTGSCTFRLASGRATNAAGDSVVGEPVTVRIVNGAFSQQIAPTDTMTPEHQSYTVSCSGARGWSKTGTWTVPTSATPLRWKDIWAPLPIAPSTIRVLPPLVYDPATGTISCPTCSTGSGAGALSLALLTDAQLLSLTDAQLLSLTN